ncbi:hypothetical protein RvY_16399 [Ramazzottius varieornatus]|uniref:Uncharacterized protein n=1 Tax=Ramazzottius varieornatus TaxID=947166 RepID=A0A1D1W4P8_RAMVA|nr:hypothetical protein RvY_16399 [Ramazzottius varieornatus]
MIVRIHVLACSFCYKMSVYRAQASFSVVFLALLVGVRCSDGRVQASGRAPTTFRNPISDEKMADPWVLFWNGSYHLISSAENEQGIPTLRVYKSNNLGDFRNAEKKVIYTAPQGTMWSKELWAPELHYIHGEFYVYYAADDGNNINHKMYVLKGDDPNNPMSSYTFMGKIFDSQKDWWGIDGTILKHRNGKNYYIYSGWDGAYNYDPLVQHLFIAEMASPTSLVPGTATLIKSPHYSWETDGQAVVEGPAVVEMNDTYYLMYSAGASWTMYYSTSVMGLNARSDPLKASSWWRSDKPVFPRNEAEDVYGPGHASFTVSPDGKEHWIVYHALDDPEGHWANRSPRAQQFFFDATGFPYFPLAAGFHRDIPLPSGTDVNFFQGSDYNPGSSNDLFHLQTSNQTVCRETCEMRRNCDLVVMNTCGDECWGKRFTGYGGFVSRSCRQTIRVEFDDRHHGNL